MPGDHGYDNEEKERKQRIKKMKAKTSKMRLAVADYSMKGFNDPLRILKSDTPEVVKKKKLTKKQALEHYNRDVTLDSEENYVPYNKENDPDFDDR